MGLPTAARKDEQQARWGVQAMQTLAQAEVGQHRVER